MHIQDKIGRDMVKLMLKDRTRDSIMQGSSRKDVFTRKLFNLFENRKTYRQDSFRMVVKKEERSKMTGLLLLPIEMKKLFRSKVIDQEQFNNLEKMINASDADFEIAQASINTLRDQRLKKQNAKKNKARRKSS